MNSTVLLNSMAGMMLADNTRLLELAQEIRAQHPPELPDLSDDEVMEMAEALLDSESLTEDDVALAIRDGLPEIEDIDALAELGI